MDVLYRLGRATAAEVMDAARRRARLFDRPHAAARPRAQGARQARGRGAALRLHADGSAAFRPAIGAEAPGRHLLRGLDHEGGRGAARRRGVARLGRGTGAHRGPGEERAHRRTGEERQERRGDDVCSSAWRSAPRSCSPPGLLLSAVPRETLGRPAPPRARGLAARRRRRRPVQPGVAGVDRHAARAIWSIPTPVPASRTSADSAPRRSRPCSGLRGASAAASGSDTGQALRVVPCRRRLARRCLRRRRHTDRGAGAGQSHRRPCDARRGHALAADSRHGRRALRTDARRS